MKKLWAAFVILSTFPLFSCTQKDKKAVDIRVENLFFDYQLSAEEGDDNLTVLIRFRDGADGDALTLPANTSIFLDGEMLTPDSAKGTGTFYELHKPIGIFAGKHMLLFVDDENNEYKQEFTFQPLTLSTYIPDTVQRNDLQLELTGLESKDYVRIMATDTLFTSEGINRLDTVKNGQLKISADDLGKLVNGPVQLELIREYEIPVEKGTDAGGKMAITYRIRREFILKD